MRKRALAVGFLLLCITLLCGFTLLPEDVLIDTKKNPVYAYMTADTFLEAFAANPKAAKEQYDDQYLLISGKLGEQDTKKKSFAILDSKSHSVTCKYDNSFQGIAGRFKATDHIAVYGKCSVLLNGDYQITDVAKVIAAPNVTSSEMYFVKDNDTCLDKKTATERSLNGGHVKYYIPNEWVGKEKPIINEENPKNSIGNMEGYQYVLNEKSAWPESLFVCYFDKQQLKEPNDIKETEDVERAILRNIEKKEKLNRFPARETTTYYDAEYDYYCGEYHDKHQRGYHTEYIFQKDGNRGLIVFLYLYHTEEDVSHLSEVLLTTRLLETK